MVNSADEPLSPDPVGRYIGYFPQPVLDDLIAKRWLPIIGAGMSHNAKTTEGKRPPLWDELGKRVAAEITDGYEYSTPMDALSTYCHLYRMPLLAQMLAKLLLVHKARPGEVHDALALLPFDMIVTTNIDFLLEKSYERTEYTRVLMDDTDLSVAPHDTAVVDILKIHGDVHHPGHLVVTEEAYDEFLINYPILATFLANLLVERTAVLIGYSMEDPDLRAIWQIVRSRLGQFSRPAFAIRVDATGTEIDRFRRRGITVIPLRSRAADTAAANNTELDPSPEARAERHEQVLKEVFEELHRYQRESMLAASRIHEESVHKQALIPLGHPTRLCLFAVPSALHSFYKEFVFPEAVRAGLVPVVEEDIESPGGNIPAEIDSLMIRASAVFVHADETTPTTAYEMRLAKVEHKSIFAVVQKGSGPYAEFSRGPHCSYKNEKALFTDAEKLRQGARDWFDSIATKINEDLARLPDLLLADMDDEPDGRDKNDKNRKKIFASALIVAYSNAEVELARRLYLDEEPGERPAPLWTLILRAKKLGWLDDASFEVMDEVWKETLDILHDGIVPDKIGQVRAKITAVDQASKRIIAASNGVPSKDPKASDEGGTGSRPDS